MSGALQHAKILAPRSDAFAVLMRHHPQDLVQVIQIMRCPRGQQLRKSDYSERGMSSAQLEVLRLQIQCAQLFQILCRSNGSNA